MTKVQKLIITFFIIFNFLAMVRVHLPMQTKAFQSLYRSVDPYLSFFSIYQDWLMFAPNPSRTNSYITAKIFFQDGTFSIYDFENAARLGLLQKYSYGERYRKFTSEGMRKDSNSWMWKDVAKFAMRKGEERNSGKKATRVELTRHWEDMPKMHFEFRPHGYKVQKFHSYTFLNHKAN